MAAAGSTSGRPGRSWGERVAIGATIVAATVCFLTAGALAAGYVVLRDREVVEISDPSERTTVPAPTSTLTPLTAAHGSTLPAVAPTTVLVPATPPPTFPPADPEAKNFLITGADNGACVDPSSPYAPAFGDADTGRVGERSDTI